MGLVGRQDHHHEQENQEELEDHFDRLPDALLLLIFNKVLDAKSLVRCLPVSKRFASLVTETDSIFFSLPLRISNPKPTSFLKIFLHKFISKPIGFIRHIITRKSPSKCNMDFEECYFSPNEALKELKQISSIIMELPCYGEEIGCKGDGNPLLKWNAEFGSELNSCVILGASSFDRETLSSSSNSNAEQLSEELDSIIGEDQLKIRIVWTVSCLIAASMRHYLIKQMVGKFSELKSVIVTDSCKQGKLRMAKKELFDLRESIKNDSEKEIGESTERTRIPDLKMKMWYVPVLELPDSGCVMWGATLVVIRPSGVHGMDGDLLGIDRFVIDNEDDKKIYGEAVRQMVKLKKSYVLEMNSF